MKIQRIIKNRIMIHTSSYKFYLTYCCICDEDNCINLAKNYFWGDLNFCYDCNKKWSDDYNDYIEEQARYYDKEEEFI